MAPRLEHSTLLVRAEQLNHSAIAASIKEPIMDLKIFNNADIDRVFDALHFGVFFVKV
jgi:hypothetical protein